MDTTRQARYATVGTRRMAQKCRVQHTLTGRPRMPQTLTPEQLDALRRFDAPTVANAIETFNVRPWNTGFMSPAIRCMFPDLGVMVGYACTAIIAADHQA